MFFNQLFFKKKIRPLALQISRSCTKCLYSLTKRMKGIKPITYQKPNCWLVSPFEFCNVNYKALLYISCRRLLGSSFTSTCRVMICVSNRCSSSKKYADSTRNLSRSPAAISAHVFLEKKKYMLYLYPFIKMLLIYKCDRFCTSAFRFRQYFPPKNICLSYQDIHTGIIIIFEVYI